MQDFGDNLMSNLEGYYLQLSDVLPKLAIGILVLFIFWLISKYLLKILSLGLSYQLEDPLVARFIVKTTRTILFGIAILLFLKGAKRELRY